MFLICCMRSQRCSSINLLEKTIKWVSDSRWNKTFEITQGDRVEIFVEQWQNQGFGNRGGCQEFPFTNTRTAALITNIDDN